MIIRIRSRGAASRLYALRTAYFAPESSLAGSPAQRLVFIGHQWLMRSNTSKAREALNASVDAMPRDNDAAWIELSRLDAAEGKLMMHVPRSVLFLAANPDNFDALTTVGYVEAKLQNYPIAAELFRHALECRIRKYCEWQSHVCRRSEQEW